jgi:hypothetical protein
VVAGRSGLRVQRLRLELVTSGMQIDLAGAESQRMTSVPENGVCHAEYTDVEVDGRVDIRDGKNELVEAIDTHEVSLASRSTLPLCRRGVISDDGYWTAGERSASRGWRRG